MADQVDVAMVVAVINDVVDGEAVHAGAKFAGVFAYPFKHALDLAEIKGEKGGDAGGLAEIKALEHNAFGLGDHTINCIPKPAQEYRILAEFTVLACGAV